MLRIDYRISGEELSEIEEHAETGRIQSQHCFAIFQLLKMADLRRELGNKPTETEIDSVSETLNSIGEIGSLLASNVFCDVVELELLHEKQSELLEEVSTFTNKEVENNA